MAEHAHNLDWSELFHARGPALDTPRHLKALLGDDAEAFVDGYSHLWSTLRREGKAWPATAPTALLVCDLLDDPLLGPDDPSLRDAMLAYLQSFGVAADLGDRAAGILARVQERSSDLRVWTAAYLAADADGRARMWEDTTGLGELVLDQATLACFDTVPEVLGRVMPHLRSERSRRRAYAAGAVGTLARHPSAAEERPTLVHRLASMTKTTQDPYELATIVTAIGRLGGDARPWLSDPSPGVRVCAALAPALADDEAATGVLLESAASPRAFSASFGDMAPPQHFQAPTPRDLLMEALLERVDDPAKLAPALIATLPLGRRTASRTRVRLLLQVLFPAWHPGSDLSPLQRDLAGLIAACDRLWELDDAAREELFQPAGLPQEHQAWATMAQPGRRPASPDQGPSTWTRSASRSTPNGGSPSRFTGTGFRRPPERRRRRRTSTACSRRSIRVGRPTPSPSPRR